MGEYSTEIVILFFILVEMNNQHINMFQSSYGKETIDTNSYGKSTGHSGNYSTNYQIIGRELMTPDEVRLLDNKYAVLFIRGEKPIVDLKYDILKHPNVKLTTDGDGKPYIHGESDKSTGTILWDYDLENYEFDKTIKINPNYKLISEEEVEEYLNENEDTEENENNESNENIEN